MPAPWRGSSQPLASSAFKPMPASDEPLLWSTDDDFPFLLPAPTPSSRPSHPASLFADDSLDCRGGVAQSLHALAAGDELSSPFVFTPVHSARPDAAVADTIERPVHSLAPHDRAPRSERRSGTTVESAHSNSHSASTVNVVARSAETAVEGRKRRRVRAGTLTPAERVERRRAQHRTVDSGRRKRENQAIAQLHGLIQKLQQQQTALDGGDSAPIELQGTVAEEDEAAGGGASASRLSVLHSSITLIERLTTACKRMDEACRAKDAQVTRVSHQLHNVAAALTQQASSLARVGLTPGFFNSGMDAADWSVAVPGYTQPWWQAPLQLTSAARPAAQSHAPPPLLSALPPPTSSHEQQADTSHNLRQSTSSLFSTMSVSVNTLPAMLLVDCNERFLALTGYTRADLTHLHMGESPLNRGVTHYPASLAAVEAVASGSSRQGSAMWRFCSADGQVHEVMVTFFALFSQLRRDGTADERRPPDRLLIMCSPDEVVLVGEAHAADVR